MLSQKPIEAKQTQTFLQKLKELDFEPIAHQLMQSGWTHQQTMRAMNRYKVFLLLIFLYPHTPLAPTQEIDQVWHCHILHTRKYREDCQMLFGYFIDHEPNLKVGVRGQGSGVRSQESGVRRGKFSFIRCDRSLWKSGLKLWEIANHDYLDTTFAQTQALLVQYFGEAALGDIKLEQPDSMELAENLPQPQQLSKKDALHLQRSACGRPESSLREIFQLSVSQCQ